MILFWPYAWSVTMSANRLNVSMDDYVLALLTGFLGSCLLHSGGCVWNDIIDIDLDAKVERTKHRPLPDGRITIIQALLFLSVHVLLLFALSHSLNLIAWRLAFLTIVPLTGLYPFMKRITYLPQVWLGITLNTPVVLASTIFTESPSKASLVLAAGGLCWTMWYDTIYGSQDKKDDIKAGVKSIVLLLQRHTWLALLIFSGIPYFIVSVGGGALLLARDLWTTDLDNPKSCLRAFERNGFMIGPVVWVGCLLDYLL
ncbi:4-hydroxybenzoate polyprenyl transferase [Mycena rebaudengoi]|nr:4-hydroxybenzoate polyprenyl transferase [Mycena rebaudengoi]